MVFGAFAGNDGARSIFEFSVGHIGAGREERGRVIPPPRPFLLIYPIIRAAFAKYVRVANYTDAIYFIDPAAARAETINHDHDVCCA
jgi:hypothetical protein